MRQPRVPADRRTAAARVCRRHPARAGAPTTAPDAVLRCLTGTSSSHTAPRQVIRSRLPAWTDSSSDDQLVLAPAQEADALVEAQGVVDVAQPDLERGPPPKPLDRLPGGRRQPEGQQQRPQLGGERSGRGGHRRHALDHRAVGLEQAAQEAPRRPRRRWSPGSPTGSAATSPCRCGRRPAAPWRTRRPATSGPAGPTAAVTSWWPCCGRHRRLEIEQLLGQHPQPLDDIEIGVGDAEPQMPLACRLPSPMK